MREFAEAGGLLSYGAGVVDAYCQVGAYTGRILKGAKPYGPASDAGDEARTGHHADTASLLGLTIPPGLLAIADEVIE